MDYKKGFVNIYQYNLLFEQNYSQNTLNFMYTSSRNKQEDMKINALTVLNAADAYDEFCLS
jgi:hypothetical protein